MRGPDAGILSTGSRIVNTRFGKIVLTDLRRGVRYPCRGDLPGASRQFPAARSRALRGRVFFFSGGAKMSVDVKYSVRLVVDVAVMDEMRGGSPLTPALARELATLHGSRPWLARIGELRWASGTPTVVSASVVDPSPMVVESDTDDMCDMGEPASVPPAAEK
jgi:hypothetical protein